MCKLVNLGEYSGNQNWWPDTIDVQLQEGSAGQLTLDSDGPTLHPEVTPGTEIRNACKLLQHVQTKKVLN